MDLKLGELPFELQRKREVVQAILREITKQAQDRFIPEAEKRIRDIVKTIDSITMEAVERQNESIRKELLDKHNQDLYRPIRLDPNTRDYILQIEKLLPEIKRLVDTLGAEAGFTDQDKKEVAEYIEFIRKLKQFKYI